MLLGNKCDILTKVTGRKIFIKGGLMKRAFLIVCIILCIAAMMACDAVDNSSDEEIAEIALPKTTLQPKAIESPSNPPANTPTKEPVVPTMLPEQTPRADWVTVFIAFDDYHEGELEGVTDALSESGYRIVLVSTRTGTAQGMGDGRIEVDVSIEDVEDVGLGIIIVGGVGIVKQWDNEQLIALVRKADEQGGLVAGICAGPGVLGNAGVLEGKAACWYDGPNTNAEMRGAGCENSGQSVTIDGNAVTGNGPSAAQEFGLAIVSILNEM